MGELHPFLERFKSEHAQILETLGALQEAGDWSAFFAYCRNEVTAHEKREELFLFTAIAAKADIRTGGPLCVLYYDHQLRRPPLASSAALCGLPRIEPRENAGAANKIFFQTGSPVCIPIEDHMALEQIQIHASTSNHSDRDLEIFATVYMDLLKFHFTKEDTCLFPMSQGLLSLQELDSWEKKCAQ